MTKTSVRNIFIGSTVVVSVVFAVLTILSHKSFPDRTHPENITAAVEHGKRVWERHACIDCHTLLGEGAYYAPELANVIDRRGVDFVRTVLETDAKQGWGTVRKMPKFDLSAEDIDGLIAFFQWMGNLNTSNWPPNKEG
ncbi:MAG: c-type cytochrome [Thermodesulfobacteriota bacterium]